MSIGPDRVRPLKLEDTGTGTQTDLFPTSLNKNEDAIECRGVVMQDASSNDALVYVAREGNDLIFRDITTGISYTLTDLVGGAAIDPGFRRHFLLMGA